MMLLPLCSWLSGCSPTAEGQSDEQLNAHYLAGKEKLGAFDYKGAVESFERALDDQPRSPLTHFELGVLYEQQEHDYAAALYHYGRVLKLRPNGNPADIARQRIPGCRQELVKADSLATINPTLLGEIQALRATNQWLLRELDVARAQLNGRGPYATPATQSPSSALTSRSVAANGPGLTVEPQLPSRGTVGSRSDSARIVPASARGRTYAVKSGDTLASIARQHGVRLESLMSGNPGVTPKKLRVGQVLNIPGS
jgi:LysM repeat protein